MKYKYLAFVFDKKIINDQFYELIPIDYVVGDLVKKKKNETLLISNNNIYRYIDKNDDYNNLFAYPFLIENLEKDELDISKDMFFDSVKDNRYFQINMKKQKKFYRLTKNGYITQIDMKDGFSFYEHDGLLYNVGLNINSITDEYIYQIIRLINVGMNSSDISKLIGDYQSIDDFEERQKIKTSSKKTLNIGSSYESLTSTIINQDNIIKNVLLTIQNNIEKSNLNYPISNILLIGPTGVGKTMIVQEVSNTLNVPFVKVDINSITEVGYVGDNVTDCLVQLYLKANGNLEQAKKGVVFIDEIDKIARNGSNDHIKTVGVQNSLLKLLEGNEYHLMLDNKKSIVFDSTNVTFIAAGAFSNITSPKIIKSVGFVPSDKIIELKNIENELIKYGMESELIGRFSKILKLNNLDLDSFKKIIFSKKSIFNYYLDLFKKYNINFEYDEKFIDAVAIKALDKMGGARGINKLIEYVFSDCLWQIYTNENQYSQLLIDENIVEDNKKYILK